MAAVVRFKFKSEHEFTAHELESGATGTTVASLKTVIAQRKQGGSMGFAFKLSNEQTGEGATRRPARTLARTRHMC